MRDDRATVVALDTTVALDTVMSLKTDTTTGTRGRAGAGRTVGEMMDLTGKQYGKLTVMSLAGKVRAQNGRVYYRWRCRCACGKVLVVAAGNLTSGNTKSCGCGRTAESEAGTFGWHICGKCGAAFVRQTPRQRVCPSCATHRRGVVKKERVKSIAEIEAEARAAGMTYGAYGEWLRNRG